MLLLQPALVVVGMPPGDEAPRLDAKLKHLEFIQAVIARMATNSFLEAARIAKSTFDQGV